MPGYSGVTVVTTLVCFFLSAREAAGALGTRHSLRPLFCWAKGFCKTSGASRRENAESCLKMERRHCEERSDEAIHAFFAATWIASLRSQ